MPVISGMVTQQLLVREGSRTGSASAAAATNVVQLVVVDSS